MRPRSPKKNETPSREAGVSFGTALSIANATPVVVIAQAPAVDAVAMFNGGGRP